MRSTLFALLLTVALLSGCVVEETPTDSKTDSEAQTAADAAPVTSAESAPAEQAEQEAAPHGTPQRTDGAVESGTDPQRVPSAYARQAITITNDVNGASLVDLTAAIAAGFIDVRTADRDGYLVEAVLETRGATEQEARDQLARTHLDHTDDLTNGTLAVSDFVRVDEQQSPVPPSIIDLGHVGTDISTTVTITITVPLAPAVSLEASSASGDLKATGLHGPELDLSTASGDVGISDLVINDVVIDTASGDIEADNVAAQAFDASTASGDILGRDLGIAKLSLSTASGDADLEGAFDDIEAGSSSGDLTLDATPVASGSYDLDSASGTVQLSLPDAGQAYHVDADTASGDIDVDVPDSETLDEDERHVEVASAGFDDASLKTDITVSTSSGDITVAAK